MFVAYGGTFDPVHCGHLAVARAAAEALGTRVHLVPAADPPHKDATHANAGQRAQMLELAIAGDPLLAVECRELDRDGPSYTVDTLASLRDEMGPAASLVWVIGADSLAQLHHWHRWRELFDSAHLLAVGRPGFSLDAASLPASAGEVSAELDARACAPADLQLTPAGRLGLLPLNPPRTESSTQIRHRIAQGQPWRAQVPAPVADYIDRHRLYAAAPASTPILSDSSGARTP